MGPEQRSRVRAVGEVKELRWPQILLTVASQREFMAKMKTPAVRHLRYEISNSSTAGTETSHYIDLARDLAAINRRAMDQGMLYHVSKITVVSRNTLGGYQTIGNPATGIPSFDDSRNAGFVSVSVAPTSWSVINACKKARENYEEMLKDGTKAVEFKKGRWNSFKVRGLHSGAQSPTYLVPQDNGGNSLQLGEWVYSTFQSPDGTTGADAWKCHILGDHIGSAGAYTSVGLVESYGNTRATVSAQPRAVASGDTDDPMANLFDDGTTTDERFLEATQNGDLPPYDLDEYAGGAGNMPRPVVVQHGTLGTDGRCTLGGFAAVHGLIELETTSPIDSDVYSVLVEVKAGSYKGIAAEAF